jgi:hypothetical protein
MQGSPFGVQPRVVTGLLEVEVEVIDELLV